MNNKRTALVLVLAGVMLWGISFYLRRQPAVTAKPVNAKTKDVGKSLYRQAQAFAGLPKAADATPAPTDPCLAFDDILSHEPMDTAIYDLKNQALKLPQNCQIKNPDRAKLYADLIFKCSAENIQINEYACTQALFSYRATIIAEAVAGKSPKELSTDLLVQKFFGLMLTDKFKDKAGNQEARVIIQEIRERLPNSPAPDRMDLVRAMAGGDFGKNPELDAAIAKARENEPDNTDLYEIDLINRKFKNDDSYTSEINRQYAADPNNTIALYHMGCIAWKNSQAIQAISYFQQAVTLAPDNKRFANTLSLAKTMMPPNIAVCSVQLSLDPDQI